MNKIKVVNMSNLPYPIIKKRRSDGGYDVKMFYSGGIKPHQTVCLRLGVKVQTPKNQACLTVPRSSIAKLGLLVHTAIIDNGYTGEIHLIATNVSNRPIYWNRGDRLISLVFFNINNKYPIKYVPELKETSRGSNGLGSSGK